MGTYKKDAMAALSGHWAGAIIVSVIASLLNGGVNFNISAEDLQNLDSLYPGFLTGFIRVMTPLLPIIALYSLVVFIIGGFIEVGYSRYCMKLACGVESGVNELFAERRILLKAFIMKLVITIKTVLWSLLFIVPGIIASYRYSMAYYIMAENPDVDAMEAIDQSKELMDGNKLNLFILQLTFIGWLVLLMAAAAAGVYFIADGVMVLAGAALIAIAVVGAIALSAYIKMATTEFYLELAGRPVM